MGMRGKILKNENRCGGYVTQVRQQPSPAKRLALQGRMKRICPCPGALPNNKPGLIFFSGSQKLKLGFQFDPFFNPSLMDFLLDVFDIIREAFFQVLTRKRGQQQHQGTAHNTTQQCPRKPTGSFTHSFLISVFMTAGVAAVISCSIDYKGFQTFLRQAIYHLK